MSAFHTFKVDLEQSRKHSESRTDHGRRLSKAQTRCNLVCPHVSTVPYPVPPHTHVAII